MGSLGSADPSEVQTAFGSVELARFGAGPAVLALHGGLGGFDQALLLARSALGEGAPFDVLAPSRPGYLGTPLGSLASPEAQADLYAALLDTLGIERVLVLAISAGGPGALAFAARHRERCAGLVLVSACTGRLDVPARVRARLPVFRVLSRLPGLVGLMGWMTARQPEQAARASILDDGVRAATLAHAEAGPLMRALQESIFHQMARRLPGTLSDTDRLAALPPVFADPPGVPTLVIHGTADRVVPFAHGERLDGSAELMAIAGGEHVCLFTHLDDVRARVAAFLDRLPPW